MVQSATIDSKTSPSKKGSVNLPNFSKLTAYLESKRNPRRILYLAIMSCKPSFDAVNDDHQEAKVGIG